MEHPHHPADEGTQPGIDPGGNPDWRALLREQGYRLTPQREQVLAAVDRLGHATPDDIVHELAESGASVNPSTVYRSLELLEELGLVRHTHLTDRAPTYHSRRLPEHVHLVCRGCGKLQDADLSHFEVLASALAEQYAFAADLGHLTVFGVCGDCAIG